MKVIIAGGRDFNDYELLRTSCDKILSSVEGEIEIISGTAKGTDSLGIQYAKERGYKLKEFPADWDAHGKAAGYIRNKQMAEYAEALIAFYDGTSKGSGHMIELAKSAGLKIRVIKYGN